MTNFVGPVLLTPEHRLSEFDCSEEALNRWLVTRAMHNQAEGGSRTWVVTVDDGVVAYYASSTAVILRTQATKRTARNQPDPVPALLLGRLAVDAKYRGQGLGAALLKHFLIKSLEVAQITGVGVLLVHANDATAANFYARYGFEPSPVDQLTLMLLIKDIASA
ncbi:MAG: GNAT family N-acetyltransferase [Actinomycetota bacterium]